MRSPTEYALYMRCMCAVLMEIILAANFRLGVPVFTPLSLSLSFDPQIDRKPLALRKDDTWIWANHPESHGQ